MCSMSALAPGFHWSVMTSRARDRLEGQRADEPRRRPRHHRHHVVAVLLQAARDLDGLVGADAAGHAECDECHRCRMLPVACQVSAATAATVLLLICLERSMISSAIGVIRCVRDRSAAMISCSRTTVGSSSIVDHDVVVVHVAARLGPRRREPALHGRLAVGAAPAQSPLENLERRRQHEDRGVIDAASPSPGVAPCTSITSTTSCPDASSRSVSDARRAIEIAEHVGPLQELAAARSSLRTRRG